MGVGTLCYTLARGTHFNGMDVLLYLPCTFKPFLYFLEIDCHDCSPFLTLSLAGSDQQNVPNILYGVQILLLLLFDFLDLLL